MKLKINSILAGILTISSCLFAEPSFQVLSKSASNGATSNQINLSLKVVNEESGESVYTSDLELSYYLYLPNLPAAGVAGLNANLGWSVRVATNPYAQVALVDNEVPRTVALLAMPYIDGAQKANAVLKINFTNQNNFAPGEELHVNFSLFYDGWAYNFNESTDWSFLNSTDFSENENVVLTSGGDVVWGNLPADAMVLPQVTKANVNWIGVMNQATITTLEDANVIAEGDMYRSLDDDKTYIWYLGEWQVAVESATGVEGPQGLQGEQGPVGSQGVQGLPGVQGAKGDNGVNGISINWLGNQTSQPASPSLNDGFYWEGKGVSCIWDGDSWELISRDGNVQATSCVFDPRDDIEYEWVTIGNQTWMASNLNFDAPGSTCYDNDPANCVLYGRMYTPASFLYGESASNTNPSHVQGVCPTGSHIPSRAEWEELAIFVVSETPGAAVIENGRDFEVSKISPKLRSTIGWNAGFEGTDDYGLGLQAGGYTLDAYRGIGRFGTYGTSSQNTDPSTSSTHPWHQVVSAGPDANPDRFRHFVVQSTNRQSIRCVKD